MSELHSILIWLKLDHIVGIAFAKKSSASVMFILDPVLTMSPLTLGEETTIIYSGSFKINDNSEAH